MYKESIVDSLSLYIFMFVIGVVTIIIMMMITVVAKKFKAKIIEFLKKQWNKFLWNGFLRSFFISYCSYCIGVFKQLKVFIYTPEYIDTGDLMMAFALFILIVTVPFIILWQLNKHKDTLKNDATKARIGNLYQDFYLNPERNKYWGHSVYFYYPLFMLRRIIYIGVPLLLWQYPWAQIQILLLFNFLYQAFYLSSLPYIDKTKFWVELFNEMII
jgi:hypothetical protein